MPNATIEFGRDLAEAREEIESRYFHPERARLTALAASFKEGKRVGAENIVGIGLGEKEVAGRATGQPCVKILVSEKLAARHVETGSLFTPETAKVLTDVEEIGFPVIQRNPTRYRPAPGGCSVSNEKEYAAGTLGCVVKYGESCAILTNNHVIARVNAGQTGEAITQPGLLDGGTASDVIARLGPYVTLLFGLQDRNRADIAIAPVEEEWCRYVLPFILAIGEVSGVTAPRVGLSVRKTGRTTGLTRGWIRAVGATVAIDYEQARYATFRDTVVIRSLEAGRPFSQPGDSGSLILSDENEACALLFAGSERATIGNPIDVALAELNNVSDRSVELWTF